MAPKPAPLRTSAAKGKPSKGGEPQSSHRKKKTATKKAKAVKSEDGIVEEEGLEEGEADEVTAIESAAPAVVAEQSELVALSGRAKLILEYEAREVALQKRRVHRQARAKAALARMTLARMTLALASPLPLRLRAKAAQPS